MTTVMAGGPVARSAKRCISVACVGLLLATAVVAAPEPEALGASLTDVEGTRIHATEEEPRVLHIVPWQAPTIASRERQPLSVPDTGAVLHPLDLEVMQVHRQYRRTLNILDVESSRR